MTHFSHKVLKYLHRIERQELENLVQELDSDLDLKDRILNATQEALLVADPFKKVILANLPFCRLIEKKEEEVLGKHLTEVLSWFSLNSNDLIENLYTDKQTVSFDFLFKAVPASIRFHAHPLLGEKEIFRGVSLSFLDISDLKEEDEKRSFNEKLKTLIPLAAGLAHEIGNPLNALDIHMQLALRETRNMTSSQKAKLEKYLNVAKEEINRLDRIVARFLGAVRPLKGNLKFKNVNETLDAALDFMAPEASLAKITVERRFQTNLPEFLYDEDQLKQAFINLIKNAIQAMPKGGLLKVQTQQNNQQIRILFTDTGVGIKKEEIEHVFEPYYSTKEKGSGLGLVAVKRIVSNHGGSVQIESTQNKGSTFILLFPLRGTQKPLLTKENGTTQQKTKK